jgi:hypothetical protein
LNPLGKHVNHETTEGDRPNRRLEDNIKIGLKEAKLEGKHWNYLTEEL